MKAGMGSTWNGASCRPRFWKPEVRAIPAVARPVFLRMVAVAGVVLCLADDVLAELTRPDFSRYEVIVTRRPFGAPKPDPTPVAVPPEVPPPPPFILKLTLCGITVDGDETRVGFLDKEKNPPVSYYLQVGEEQGGFKVISADYEAGSVLLEKDGRQETLTMADGTAAGGARTPAAAAAAAAVAAASPRPAAPAVDRTSLADRIKKRREELMNMRGGGQSQATPPPAPAAPTSAVGGGRSVTAVPSPAPAPAPLPPPLDAAAAAAMEKKTREYNMELIRAKGEKGPPLPIQLTEDEDAQLVNEGVLEPPQ